MDLPSVKAIIDATELFPSELLDGMIGELPEVWLVACAGVERRPVGTLARVG